MIHFPPRYIVGVDKSSVSGVQFILSVRFHLGSLGFSQLCQIGAQGSWNRALWIQGGSSRRDIS